MKKKVITYKLVCPNCKNPDATSVEHIGNDNYECNVCKGATKDGVKVIGKYFRQEKQNNS